MDDHCRLPENRLFPASLIDLTGLVVIGQPFYKLMAGADEMPDSLPAILENFTLLVREHLLFTLIVFFLEGETSN
jgi:hypothetical protein